MTSHVNVLRWSPTPPSWFCVSRENLTPLWLNADDPYDCLRQRHGADIDGNLQVVPADKCRVALHRTGKASANGFVESFNGNFRDECLNENTVLAAGKCQGPNHRMEGGLQQALGEPDTMTQE